MAVRLIILLTDKYSQNCTFKIPTFDEFCIYILCIYFHQNAMRAVVEQHAQLDEVPKLKILIVKGQEDLTIKVTTVQ